MGTIRVDIMEGPQTIREKIWSVMGILLAAQTAERKRAYITARAIRRTAVTIAQNYGLKISRDWTKVWYEETEENDGNSYGDN